MEKKNINKDSENVHGALKALRKFQIEHPPYLKQKILASFEEKKRSMQKWIYFFTGAAVSGTLALLLVFIGMKHQPLQPLSSTFQVGPAYVLKVDLREIANQRVAYVEVEVEGESLQFFSQTHLDLSEQSKLIFEWEHLNGKNYLPIVIRGLKAGEGKIRVTFFDGKNEKIDDRMLSVFFGDKI